MEKKQAWTGDAQVIVFYFPVVESGAELQEGEVKRNISLESFVYKKQHRRESSLISSWHSSHRYSESALV